MWRLLKILEYMFGRVFDAEGRLAQRESIGLTSRGSQVQILYRPPDVAAR
jgi:hypothetical protein